MIRKRLVNFGVIGRNLKFLRFIGLVMREFYVWEEERLFNNIIDVVVEFFYLF